jgi:hypothetical protein
MGLGNASLSWLLGPLYKLNVTVSESSDDVLCSVIWAWGGEACSKGEAVPRLVGAHQTSYHEYPWDPTHYLKELNQL